MSDRFESIVTPIPGPRSRAVNALIARYEARGVTYVGDDYPVAWERAHGALVTDVDGNRYLDLTAAFGVAAVGHTNDRVRDSIDAQAGRLIHGMGDVHPPVVKAQLLERLAAIAPGDCSKTFFGSTAATRSSSRSRPRCSRPAVRARSRFSARITASRSARCPSPASRAFAIRSRR